MKNMMGMIKQFQLFEKQIEDLETKVLELELKIQKMISIERNHLIRLKNGEPLSDEFINSGRSYNDLSPEMAWKIYNNPNINFILIDVSSADYEPKEKLAEAMHIPWEEFPEKFLELSNHTIPILIISEDGTKSVLACEYLVKRGFYNCNNISGGYQFWKGFQANNLKSKSA